MFQVLPVVRKGNRSAIVSASIKSSEVWDGMVVLELKKNMRVCGSCSDEEEAKAFSDWLLAIGDGTIASKTFGGRGDYIPISGDIVVDSLVGLVNVIFPDLLDAEKVLKSAILCPTNKLCDSINEVVSVVGSYGC